MTVFQLDFKILITDGQAVETSIAFAGHYRSRRSLTQRVDQFSRLTRLLAWVPHGVPARLVFGNITKGVQQSRLTAKFNGTEACGVVEAAGEISDKSR